MYIARLRKAQTQVRRIARYREASECRTVVLVRQLGADLEELRYQRVSVLGAGGSDLATLRTVPRSTCTWLSISLCNTHAQPRRRVRTSSPPKEKNLWRRTPNSSFNTPFQFVGDCCYPLRSRHTTSCTPKSCSTGQSTASIHSLLHCIHFQSRGNLTPHLGP
jgi:hypothetical protein